MPCNLKKNLSEKNLICKKLLPIFNWGNTCEEMGEFECKQYPQCCEWKISGWDIFLIVFAAIILLLGLIILVWYVYKKYYLKQK
jgi:hypothetical protein